MNLNYSFKHIRLAPGFVVKEPIIRARLFGKNGKSLETSGVLDTGSDCMLIPLEIAETIGLEFSEKKKETAKSYSGSTMTTTKSKVKVRVERKREHIEFEVRCMILLDENSQHEDIIFGSTFLENFRCIFDYPRNRFQLKER